MYRDDMEEKYGKLGRKIVENDDLEDLKQKQFKILTENCNRLMEHFDSVHIFASAEHVDGSISVHIGKGNWYTRFGQIKEWIIREEQRCRNDLEDEGM